VHRGYENGQECFPVCSWGQVGDLKEAIKGYRRFQQLVEQYVELVLKRPGPKRGRLKKKTHPATPAGPRPGNPAVNRAFQIAEPTGWLPEAFFVFNRLAREVK